MCMKKTALIMEGGALRGIFTAGVIDCFLDNGIVFDYVCGVSAGACNTLAYIGNGKGFIKKAMIQKDKKESFYGVSQMLESHKYVDLDKVFYEYTNDYGFDMQDFVDHNIAWEMAVSNMETAQAEYLHSDDIDEIRLIGKASCSIPLLTDPVEIKGKKYLDGGICDPVPLIHAMELGYENLVVICTRKQGSYSITTDVEKALCNRVYEDYPLLLEAISKRNELYKQQMTMCDELAKEGKIILIRPTIKEVATLQASEDDLSLFYYHGYLKGQDNLKDIEKLL